MLLLLLNTLHRNHQLILHPPWEKDDLTIDETVWCLVPEVGRPANEKKRIWECIGLE
jgi:hypothetical protein